MTEEAITVAIRPVFKGIDDEIKALSSKLGSLNSILKKTVGQSVEDMIYAELSARVAKYKDEIKKAGEDAVRELEDKAAAEGRTLTEDEKNAAKKNAENKKIEEISKDETKVGRLANIEKYTPDSADKQMLGLMKSLSESFKGVGESLIKFSKEAFGFLEDIYKEMRKSSPLLQTMEQLFNLAWTLFFMPLGNKLGELMIPAVLEMMDAVMGIWDMFDGKDLGEMLSIAVVQGVKLIAEYLLNLGEILADESGIVGSIGNIMMWVGNFLSDKGVALVEIGFKMLEFFIGNFNWVIFAIYESFLASAALTAGYYTASMVYLAGITLLLGEIGSVFTIGVSDITAAGVIATSTGVGAATAGGVELWGNIGGAYVANQAGLNLWDSYATGGYVEATPGGQPIIVGEGGEGEWIIPESKINSFMNSVLNDTPNIVSTENAIESNVSNNVKSISQGGSNITQNYYINGYTDSELKDIIKGTVNEMVTLGHLRSGF